MSFARKKLFLLLGLLSSLLLPGLAAAQATDHVVVTDQLVIEGAQDLSIDVYFTLQDGSGRPLPAAQVESASILLEDGTTWDARVERLPYYVALVLDASGSMGGVIDEVRSAAVELINAAPDGIYFAVIRFDENISLLQPFTDNRAQAIDAVSRVEIDDSGTCLYDVAHTAVQVLEQVARNAPRRAMVLFTDGRDEIRQGAAGACSEVTAGELIDFANNRPVPIPIHAIGIAESVQRINSEELSSLARETGGRSAIGDGEMLSSVYSQIVEEVSGQWIARADLRPTFGGHRGALFIKLADGGLPLSGPISFASTRNFQPPPPEPDPVTVAIRNFVYDETADLYHFDVLLTSFQSVGSLDAEIVDAQNNVQVARVLYDDPSISQQIRVGASQLDAGRQYLARVHPRGLTGDVLFDEAGDDLLAEHPFRYDPPKELVFTIDAVEVTAEAPVIQWIPLRVIESQAELMPTLHIENQELIALLDGRLISQQGNLQVDDFRISGERLAAEGAPVLLLPLGTAAGTYTLAMDAVGEDGSRLASSRYTFNFVPPDPPLARALTALQQNSLLSTLGLSLLFIATLAALRLGFVFGRRGRKRTPLLPDVAADAAIAHPTANGLPAVVLRVVDSPDEALVNGAGQPITRVPFSIGREGCDLTISGDRHISRKHAQITYQDGIFFIEDFDSGNGTFVNDARIAANRPTPLSTDIGARITVGKTTRLTFAAEGRSLPTVREMEETAGEPATGMAN